MNLKSKLTSELQNIVWASVGIKIWSEIFQEVRRPVREKVEDGIYFPAHFNHQSKI